MRIVDRKTFLAMPPGTVYAKGEPFAFGNICIKGDSLSSDDWIYRDLDSIEAHDSGEMMDRQFAMLEQGASYPLDDAYQRDGCFDQDEFFLIYEPADVRAIIEALEPAAVGP